MNDAGKFRARAIHCRELARDARDEFARRTLNAMANELDDEAQRIDTTKAEHPSQE